MRRAVVAGAGLGGLTAAHALARTGWQVHVLEKQAAPAAVHKGELLQPRSIAVFERLGVLASLLDAGPVRVERLVCREPDGRPLVALDYRTLPSPHDHLLGLYYPTIVRVLESTLPAAVELRRGARVTGIVEAGGRIRGVRAKAGGEEWTEAADLVVAADGMGSTLRTAAGLELSASRYPHRLLAFDLVAPPGGLGDRDVSAYLTPRGLRLLYPMPGGRARLYVQTTPDEYRLVGRAGLPAWAEDVLAGVPGLRRLSDRFLAALPSVQPLSAYRYLAPAWSRPGLALVGDAAHGVHPMAAQGMNAAIADGYALAEAVSCGHALDEALVRYGRESASRVAYTSRLSHSLARIATDTTWPVGGAARWAVRRGLHNPRLQQLLTYNMSGLGVRRFSRRDRLYLAGVLRDPHADRLELSAC